MLLCVTISCRVLYLFFLAMFISNHRRRILKAGVVWGRVWGIKIGVVLGRLVKIFKAPIGKDIDYQRELILFSWQDLSIPILFCIRTIGRVIEVCFSSANIEYYFSFFIYNVYSVVLLLAIKKMCCGVCITSALLGFSSACRIFL